MNELIPAKLANFRRAGLIQAPLIIHALPRLSFRMDQRIYVLRDDLTGFGLGGNKTRKLDELLGDALAKEATALVTTKATSFSRNAAFAAAACGMSLDVVLPGREAEHNPLSRALFEKLGTRLHYEVEGTGAVDERVGRVVADLEQRGETVYVLHPGGSDEIGALSYVRVLHEILGYSEREGVTFSHVVHSSSSAGTQAGLIVGQCLSGFDGEIFGISARRSRSESMYRLGELTVSTAQMIGASPHAARIAIEDRFVGGGYAKPSEAGEEAADVFARLEGILLDPVYTGKAAAALLELASIGRFGRGNVLFIHTGGNAGLYY